MASPEEMNCDHNSGATMKDRSNIAEIIGFVPINTWIDFEGCSRGAIDMRISKGIWLRGVHVVKPKGGKMMVNLKAAKKWLTQSSRVA